MKYFLLPMLIFFFTLPLVAQSNRAIVDLYPSMGQGRWQSPVYEIPLQDIDPFLSYFLEWSGSDVQLSIRFSADGQTWTDWQSMPRDEHSPELPLSVLRSTEKEMRYFQLDNRDQGSDLRKVSCHFFSPGATKEMPALSSGSSNRSCSDLAPEFINRSNWCPSGNCSEHPNPSFAEVTHLIIHHSAGKNQSGDWPAEVRSIWDFHVNGRGWSDIGYNWLIDPEGHIYMGRSNDAIGAHFCGTNTGTIGICMLGNFMEESPKPEAIAALKELLSWKACENGIDPLATVYHASSGKMLSTVSGHRDGCATACPGDLLYPQLPDIRNTLTEDQTTAVKDQDQLLDFQLYPNPNPGQFHILLPTTAPQGLEAGIFDLLGHQLRGPFVVSSRQEATFDTALPNGTYFLVLQSKGQVVGVQKVNIFH